MITPRIIKSHPKRIIGLSMRMTLATSYLTGKLWGQFMPRRNEISNAVSNDKLSLQVFNDDFNWEHNDGQTSFVKWAGLEVTDYENIPHGMQTLDIEEGLYAVFIHKGESSKFPETLDLILNQWLPLSDYVYDNGRPQYELLGEKYINNHPDSEEQVWFPIKPIHA